MSDFYDELADTAVELLAEFGAPVILARGGRGDYDTETGSTAAGAVQTFTAAGVALDYKQRDIDGTRILSGDRQVLIAPDLGTTPTAGDRITLADGAVVTVIDSTPLAPTGTVVLHQVQVRGG